MRIEGPHEKFPVNDNMFMLVLNLFLLRRGRRRNVAGFVGHFGRLRTTLYRSRTSRALLSLSTKFVRSPGSRMTLEATSKNPLRS
jgi:hypothetical protein